MEGNRSLETQFAREQAKDDEQRENDKGASYRKWKETCAAVPWGLAALRIVRAIRSSPVICCQVIWLRYAELGKFLNYESISVRPLYVERNAKHRAYQITPRKQNYIFRRSDNSGVLLYHVIRVILGFFFVSIACEFSFHYICTISFHIHINIRRKYLKDKNTK